jgi:hypothetical protein
MPAKKDPNPGKLELRRLFFSSLIFISFAKTVESRFRHKHQSRLRASREAGNFVSNTGSKLLVYQRQIDGNLKGLSQEVSNLRHLMPSFVNSKYLLALWMASTDQHLWQYLALTPCLFY